MTIAKARYYSKAGYPMLGFELDGHEVALCSECKPTVHEAGIVYVGLEHLDALGPITLEVDGFETVIEGATRDRRVFGLYDQFLRDCADGRFAEGPVAIPA